MTTVGPNRSVGTATIAVPSYFSNTLKYSELISFQILYWEVAYRCI